MNVPSNSDEEMEETNPIEANDSDYDPHKETKKEAGGHTPASVAAATVEPLVGASMVMG